MLVRNNFVFQRTLYVGKWYWYFLNNMFSHLRYFLYNCYNVADSRDRGKLCILEAKLHSDWHASTQYTVKRVINLIVSVKRNTASIFEEVA